MLATITRPGTYRLRDAAGSPLIDGHPATFDTEHLPADTVTVAAGQQFEVEKVRQLGGIGWVFVLDTGTGHTIRVHERHAHFA